jgi:hypothetical protein
MPRRRRIYGYIDREHLSEAGISLQEAIDQVGLLLEKADRTGAGWIYQYAARLAQAHSRVREHLSEVKRIREESDVKELPRRLQAALGDLGISLETHEARECLQALTGSAPR